MPNLMKLNNESNRRRASHHQPSGCWKLVIKARYEICWLATSNISSLLRQLEQLHHHQELYLQDHDSLSNRLEIPQEQDLDEDQSVHWFRSRFLASAPYGASARRHHHNGLRPQVQAVGLWKKSQLHDHA